MMTMTDSPRIYVASLSDYNAGRLHGVWIDATQDVEDIEAEVQAMLASSVEQGSEEWAIHDHDGFMGVSVGEYATFAEVSSLAKLIGEHGAAFAAFVKNEGTEYADEMSFLDSFRGEWSSVEEYAQDLAGDIMPSREASELAETWPFTCIDWGRAARELLVAGDIWTAPSDGGVFVFGPY